jgi:hypothetical protein
MNFLQSRTVKQGRGEVSDLGISIGSFPRDKGTFHPVPEHGLRMQWPG